MTIFDQDWRNWEKLLRANDNYVSMLSTRYLYNGEVTCTTISLYSLFLIKYGNYYVFLFSQWLYVGNADNSRPTEGNTGSAYSSSVVLYTLYDDSLNYF